MLPYDQTGPTTGLSLIFLHALVYGNRKLWLTQLASLQDRYHLVAVDLPGYGDLAHLPYSTDAADRLLTEVITLSTRGPVVLVGYGFGGYVALSYATGHPHQIEGLVLGG